MKATTIIGIIGVAAIVALVAWGLSRLEDNRPMTQAERDKALLRNYD